MNCTGHILKYPLPSRSCLISRGPNLLDHREPGLLSYVFGWRQYCIFSAEKKYLQVVPGSTGSSSLKFIEQYWQFHAYAIIGHSYLPHVRSNSITFWIVSKPRPSTAWHTVYILIPPVNGLMWMAFILTIQNYIYLSIHILSFEIFII